MKGICKWLLLKIYQVLLFWFLEDISEVAVCPRSTKENLFSISCRPLAWNFIKLKTALWIFFNKFYWIFILRAHFLQDSSGRLLLIITKLDIQTFNSKNFFSLKQYYWHVIFDHIMNRNNPQNFKNINHSWCFQDFHFIVAYSNF